MHAGGSPNPAADMPFQLIRERDTTAIWNDYAGSVTCKADGTVSVDLSHFNQTQFPSVAAWMEITGATSVPYHRVYSYAQRSFSMLWYLAGPPALPALPGAATCTRVPCQCGTDPSTSSSSQYNWPRAAVAGTLASVYLGGTPPVDFADFCDGKLAAFPCPPGTSGRNCNAGVGVTLCTGGNRCTVENGSDRGGTPATCGSCLAGGAPPAAPMPPPPPPPAPPPPGMPGGGSGSGR